MKFHRPRPVPRRSFLVPPWLATVALVAGTMAACLGATWLALLLATWWIQ